MSSSPIVVCTEIDNLEYVFNYVGVNLRVTFDGIVVSFPSGYGSTATAAGIAEDTKDLPDESIVFNSFNSVIGQYEPRKKMLRLLKDPLPFIELRDEIKQKIKHAIHKINKAKVPLTKEMIESCAFPVDKFENVFSKS